MSTLDSSPRRSWLERFSPLPGLVFAVLLLIAFFTSEDYGDTAAAVVDYAENDEANIWLMALLGLATPALMGWFVAGLAARIPATEVFSRALVVVGGSVFIALITVGFTIWSAPLLDDNLSESTAETYLALDDFGWVIIGAGGVGMGVMIIGASLAAIRLRWVPAWLGWVSLAIGVLAFASVAAIGLFAWLGWVILASVLLLVRGDRMLGAAGPS